MCSSDLADISQAIGVAGLANAGIDLAPYPNVHAWYGRMWSRPSFQRVGAEIGAALAAMAAAQKGEVSEG